MPLKSETWIVVGDGARAQFYAVHAIPLRLTKVKGGALKATRRSTHGPEHKPDSRHIAQVARGRGDHQRHENIFLERVAGKVADAVTANQVQHLIIALPPKALAHFRKTASAAVRKLIKAEIPKDWTPLGVRDLEKNISAYLP